MDNSEYTGDPTLDGEPPAVDISNYSLAGVLEYLSKEFRRFEAERDEWMIERTQLVNRISELEAKQRSNEVIKFDLMRRVKMLEYALRQERIKYSGSNEGETSSVEAPPLVAKELKEKMTSAERDRLSENITRASDGKSSRSTEKLTKYLQDLDSSEAWTFLSKSSFTASKILSENENIPIPQRRFTHIQKLSEPTQPTPEAQPSSSSSSSASPSFSADDKKTSSPPASASASASAPTTSSTSSSSKSDDGSSKKSKKKKKSKNNNNNNNDKSSHNANSDINDDDVLDVNVNVKNEDSSSSSKQSHFKTAAAAAKQWKNKYSLRSHLDSVRSISFHPSEPLVASASEDGTVKLWNLSKINEKRGWETEPLFTYRGHQNAVLTTDLSAGDRNMLFSAGLDGTVRMWELPPMEQKPYAEMGHAIALSTGTLEGHTDAIWDIECHPHEQLLLSAAADRSVVLWDINAESISRTFTIPGPDDQSSTDAVPTAVSIPPSDVKKFVATYTSSQVTLFDMETGKDTWQFVCDRDELSASSSSSSGNAFGSLINQVATHPTMPVAATAHEDHSIRFFDFRSGKCIDKMIGHKDGVACLAFDPNGLYMASGGHDTSLRIWDTQSKACVQEMTAHRGKHDEAVHSVAFHPSKTFLGSAGADSIIKLYQ